MRYERHSTDSRSAGFILVAVMWILGLLAALVAVYALYIRQTTAIFPYYDHRLQSEALAEAGIELAAYRLSGRSPPAVGNFSFPLNNARVNVDFRSENARIDLNFAPEDLLAGLFTGVGVGPTQAQELSRRISAWRAAAPQNGEDGEADRYRTAAQSYVPPRSPFQHVDELGLVLGVTPVLLDRIKPSVTVYSGQPEINLVAATPEVLTALPGMTPEKLSAYLSGEKNAPLDVLMARLGTMVRYVTTSPGDSYRLHLQVEFGSDRPAYRYEAVILLVRQGTEPYKLLSWQDKNDVNAQSAATGLN